MTKLGVLASGQGSTLMAVHQACQNDILNAEVVAVISNVHNSGVAQYAQNQSLPFLHVSNTESAEKTDAHIVEFLTQHSVDWVLLLGYVKKIGAGCLRTFAGKIINSHPSLLPAYGGKGMYGKHVYSAILRNNERETGVTIHFVDSEYDSGQIIAQQAIDIQANDTVESLSTRVKIMEKKLLLATLAQLFAV